MTQRERAIQRYMLCANLGTTAQVGLNIITLPSGTMVVLYEDHIAALADERRRALDEAAKMVSDEPELEGEIPAGIRLALQSSSLEEITRAAVRATKRSILANIAKAQAGPEEGA